MTTAENINTENLTAALKAAKSGEAAKRARASKPTPEQLAELEAEKVAKRAARDAERAQKRALLAAKKPHMAKVERAAAKLPGLNEVAQGILNEVFEQLDASAIAAFIVNVQHRVRAESTASASNVKLTEGATVRILTTPNGQHIGSLGTVVEARRIRCIVTPEGTEKRLYLFNTDVEPLAEAIDVSSGGEGSLQNVG